MCAVTPPATLALPMDARAARQARSFVRDALCPSHSAGLVDDAQLLVSELVANAVRHGAPPVTLEVGCEASTGMTGRVSDGDPRLPTLGYPGDQDESGRGVALIDLISDDWGVELTPPGKAVWFRLTAHT